MVSDGCEFPGLQARPHLHDLRELLLHVLLELAQDAEDLARGRRVPGGGGPGASGFRRLGRVVSDVLSRV